MGKRVIILNFHGIGTPGRTIPADEEPYWIEPSFFESVLDLIQARSDVQVTLDDSNASDYEIALPALKKRGIPAKTFVLAKELDEKGYVTSAQLRELQREGITIGNHGMVHRPWTTLDASALERELIFAKEVLEQIIAQPVTQAACPFGRYNHRVLLAARKAGYETVYTSDDWPATPSCWIQPRYTLLRSHSLADVDKIITHQPTAFGAAWPELKLKLKQLR